MVYRWHEGVSPPASMRISQVYGYLFDDHGRVVVFQDGPDWGLPGGTPEPTDGGHVATLVREVREEVQVEIVDPVYLGYQEVQRPGVEPYAQLRMAARITRFLAREPDPDTGRVHVRRRCSVAEALALLDWGRATEEQAKAAARIASARWRLPTGETLVAYTD
ncbi:NUDIX hydrolase [Halostreptopolyspora alba]|uniref:NUDIX hydrolase n=1 Tax=Halostreptopolyspora alba TaxID=2487137 RepID=A0A3N0EGJ4_9ACTN|nr:NUDIX hydrolase [Nocardiopsaceae bacterium YIM 96095]